MRSTFSDDDMWFIVTSGRGTRYGLLLWEKRSTYERHLEFFEWCPSSGEWRPMKMRRTALSWLNSILWEATWIPMVTTNLQATADGFEFTYASENHDGANFWWRATCSAKGWVRLERQAPL